MYPYIFIYTCVYIYAYIYMYIYIYIYICCIVTIMNMHIYTYTCRIHIDAMNRQVKTSCVWKGVGDRTELQYIDPHSYGHQRLFLAFQGCSTGGPGAQLSAECCSLYRILSLTSLISKPHWLPVFTELYNGSIAHSISLEWHVWSLSSGNNCHAVHRSLSSGASLWNGMFGRVEGQYTTYICAYIYIYIYRYI